MTLVEINLTTIGLEYYFRPAAINPGLEMAVPVVGASRQNEWERRAYARSRATFRRDFKSGIGGDPDVEHSLVGVERIPAGQVRQLECAVAFVGVHTDRPTLIPDPGVAFVSVDLERRVESTDFDFA